MGFSLPHLLLLLLVVLLVFGSGKIKNLGSDLGEAVRGFKKGMSGDEAPKIKDEGANKPDGNGKSWHVKIFTKSPNR